MDIFLLITGLVIVVVAANIMTDGASGIATRYGLSEFIVGVTIIAIGTSSPELVVSLLSAIRGETAIALGNVVGSNMFNTLAIVGITAMITPLSLTSNNVRKDIPFGVLATVILVICAADHYLDNGAAPVISRTEGLLMLCFFAIYLAYNIFSESDSKRLDATSTLLGSVTRDVPAGLGPCQKIAGSEAVRVKEGNGDSVRKGKKPKKIWLLLVMTIGGLAGLVIGGDIFLDAAVSIAHTYGISDTVIAVTIVAGGTSLPELAASIVAAVKKKPGIALGNILGSNVLNIFLVLGASATVSPLGMGDIGMIDLFVVFLAAALMFVAAFTFRSKRIDRIEGAIFVILYIAYIFWVLKR